MSAKGDRKKEKAMKAGFYRAACAAVLACGVACVSGCGDASKPSAAQPKAPEQKSTARTVVEGVTGKAAADQGLKARDQLRAVDAQRRADMETLDK
jgi:hypothetical protein